MIIVFIRVCLWSIKYAFESEWEDASSKHDQQWSQILQTSEWWWRIHWSAGEREKKAAYMHISVLLTLILVISRFYLHIYLLICLPFCLSFYICMSFYISVHVCMYVCTVFITHNICINLNITHKWYLHYNITNK